MPRKPKAATAQPAPEPAITSPEPAHSALGASGAERWMNCPGSHDLIAALNLPESDEEDWRREGLALHEAAAHCLTNGLDAWEVVGSTFHETVIDVPMGEALGLYIEHCRPLLEATNTGGVEFRVASDLHPKFFGTADCWAVAPWPGSEKNALHIRDLKGGVGIVVDAFENPQLMYYAFGVLDTLERTRHYTFGDDMPVVVGIVQPRAFHVDGPVRLWETTVGAIKEWAHSVLQPAMVRAEMDNLLMPGEHCRFCPAKLACPMLQGLFEALCKTDPSHVVNWSDENLDRSYALMASARFAQKAIEEEVFRRAGGGTHFESAKLVNKRANRVFPHTVIVDETSVELGTVITMRFGKDGWTEPQIKSPPAIEALGPRGKEFVKEFAHTPFTGLTIAPRKDQRTEVKAEPTSEVFKSALDAGSVGG